MSYVFHPDAEAEHLESVAYYESKKPGLGASYLAEFEKVLGQVCESPQRYPIERKPDLRACSKSRSRDAVQGKSDRKSGAYTQYVSILRSLLTPQCAL